MKLYRLYVPELLCIQFERYYIILLEINLAVEYAEPQVSLIYIKTPLLKFCFITKACSLVMSFAFLDHYLELVNLVTLSRLDELIKMITTKKILIDLVELTILATKDV